MKVAPYRIGIISDMHCGHNLGLTPPKWRRSTTHDKVWDWYTSQVKKAGRLNLLVSNGDAIDGRGERSDGVELLTSDRSIQTEMAAECIKVFKAPKHLIIHGTDYHIGRGENWEKVLSSKLECSNDEMDEYVKVSANGKNPRIIHFRHHVGNSTVPYGKQTPLTKEAIYNLLGTAIGRTPKAHYLVRSHIHYHTLIEEPTAGWTVISTPGLQLPGTKYSKRLTGRVDFGFLVLNIDQAGDIKCERYVADLPQLKRTAKRY